MKLITVTCPKCRESLEIDLETRTVVRHCAESAKPKPGSDFLGERLRKLEEEKTRREAVVAESHERERTKRSHFDELFKKVKEEGASGKAAEKPLREIDVD